MDIQFTRHNVTLDTKLLRIAVFRQDLSFTGKDKPKEVFQIIDIPNSDGSPEVKLVMDLVNQHKNNDFKGQKEIFVFVEGK